MEENNEKLTGIFKQGYGIIPKAVMRYKNISIQAKSVYAYLSSFAGKKDEAYPSRGLMCHELNISQDSLTKYIKELVDNKLIFKYQDKQEGRFANNVYVLNLELDIDNQSTKNQVTENSIMENISITNKDISIMENSASGFGVNEHMITNNNNENNNNTNNNNVNNNNINNNNIYNNNRESEPSLQALKSMIKEYINNSIIIELLISFIDLKQSSDKPFKTKKQLKCLIDRLNSIESVEDRIDCLRYSLSHSYLDIYPDRYEKFSTESNNQTNRNKGMTPEEIEEMFKGKYI